ncbi:MAG: hypothetical protein Q4C70_08820, partial [Planctomycetia bacterium]|nr:hypothetical protein [Planctomycetia bacterium]
SGRGVGRVVDCGRISGRGVGRDDMDGDFCPGRDDGAGRGVGREGGAGRAEVGREGGVGRDGAFGMEGGAGRDGVGLPPPGPPWGGAAFSKDVGSVPPARRTLSSNITLKRNPVNFMIHLIIIRSQSSGPWHDGQTLFFSLPHSVKKIK